MSEDLPGMLAVAKGIAEQRWPHTMDAQVWAREFSKTFAELHEGCELDEGWLIGWFANAIMAGYDTAQARAKVTVASEKPATEAPNEEYLALLGTLAALDVVIVSHDQPVIAAEIIRAAGSKQVWAAARKSGYPFMKALARVYKGEHLEAE